MNKRIEEKLKLLPNLPGSYQMLDTEGTIIYVGKAKNLKRRVSSYFNREHTGKTKKLVENIDDFTYIVATSETEAFLIEINLIKKYDPKYNIMLRDDKTYPYIEYIKKPYPRLKIARYTQIKKQEGRLLFGPYPNAYAARSIVNLLNRLYPLKKCEGNPKELCLYYHIGECLGYCKKKETPEQVEAMESEILSFLRGNDSILKDKINKKIEWYSENLQFELAGELHKELKDIEYVLEKQKIDTSDLINRDVWGQYFHNGYMGLHVFFIRNGKLVGSKNDLLAMMEEEETLNYIAHFYTRNEVPKEIIVHEEVDTSLLEPIIQATFVKPQKGMKKELLKMADMNAKIHYENNFKLLEKDEERTTKANEELASILGIPNLRRIELFDNSHLFGTYAVSAMVVYEDGKPNKNEYRKYKVQSYANDDYHTMQEVLYRRYYRALVEKTRLPELIIVDGGELQIKAANEIVKELELPIHICGLKKDDHHRTNTLVLSDMSTIEVDTQSNVFHFLTRMQDEVHRFAITYHRELRSKGSIQSVLEDVEGIGAKRRKQLIRKYGSIKKMQEASLEDLQQILPEAVALNLKQFLENYRKE